MEAIGSKVLFLILLISVAGKIIYSWWNLFIAIKDAKVTHYFPVISLMLIKYISATMD
jgi:hypothetical protein